LHYTIAENVGGAIGLDELSMAITFVNLHGAPSRIGSIRFIIPSFPMISIGSSLFPYQFTTEAGDSPVKERAQRKGNGHAGKG
jgi:hypothetical protein